MVQLHRHFAISRQCKFITNLDAISSGAFVLANPGRWLKARRDNLFHFYAR
jgi:hypothetical protein